MFVSHFEFNGCTGEFTSAFSVDNDAAYEQQRVESASIAGTFELVDDFPLEPIGTLVVDVDLEGVGDISRSNSRSTFQSGDVTFRSRSQGTFRNAELTGTINLDGEEFVGTGLFAQLSDSRSGDMTVSRQDSVRRGSEGPRARRASAGID